jgi:hypothetical protein
MAGRILTTVRTVAIALGLLLLFGYAAGARTVFAHGELRCPPGYTAQPASMITYECRPPWPDPTTIRWSEVVTTRDEVGLYLVNLRVRVLHLDFVAGTEYWLAFDVPPPPYG